MPKGIGYGKGKGKSKMKKPAKKKGNTTFPRPSSLRKPKKKPMKY